MNPPKYCCTDDMADLTYLNDASVFGNLRDRYSRWLIYVGFFRKFFILILMIIVSVDLFGLVLRRHQSFQTIAHLHHEGRPHVPWQETY